jgi:hypothetical protein
VVQVRIYFFIFANIAGMSMISYFFKFSYFFLIGTQALVRPGSPNSSLSADDRATIVPICRAKAVVDATPNPYDKDALRFKVGYQIF